MKYVSGNGSLSRRAFLGALGMGVAGVVTACGANHGTSGGSGGGGGKAGKASLTQMYHQYGETGTQQAAERYAASYPGADVTVIWVPATSNYAQQLTTKLAGGKGPDCFEMSDGSLSSSMATAKEVEPLDDLLTGVKDDFGAAELESLTIDGHIYAIPEIVDPQMVYYRKSLFAAKGIQPPQTLDEWIAAAKELNTNKVKGAFLGNDANTTVSALINPLIAATGGTFLTKDHKVGINWNSFAQALVKLRQFNADKSLLLGAPQDWTNPDAFDNQLCAMQWQGMWAVPQMTKAFPNDVGCFPLPGLDATHKAVWEGGWASVVNAKGSHVDAAKAFTKWLWVDNTKDQADWALHYGFHIPPRKSVAKTAKALQSGVAADSVKFTDQYGFLANPYWTPAMGTALSDAVTEVVGKKADPSTALSAAQKTINQQLDQMFG